MGGRSVSSGMSQGAGESPVSQAPKKLSKQQQEARDRELTRENELHEKYVRQNQTKLRAIEIQNNIDNDEIRKAQKEIKNLRSQKDTENLDDFDPDVRRKAYKYNSLIDNDIEKLNKTINRNKENINKRKKSAEDVKKEIDRLTRLHESRIKEINKKYS